MQQSVESDPVVAEVSLYGTIHTFTGSKLCKGPRNKGRKCIQKDELCTASKREMDRITQIIIG